MPEHSNYIFPQIPANYNFRNISELFANYSSQDTCSSIQLSHELSKDRGSLEWNSAAPHFVPGATYRYHDGASHSGVCYITLYM